MSIRRALLELVRACGVLALVFLSFAHQPALASGTEGEREILVNELRREMAASILRRIDAVSRMVQAQSQAVPVEPAPAAPEGGDAD